MPEAARSMSFHARHSFRGQGECSPRNSDGRCVNSGWQRHEASPSDGLSGDGLQRDGHKSKIGTWKRALEYPKQEGCESRKDWRWQVVKTLGGTGDYA